MKSKRNTNWLASVKKVLESNTGDLRRLAEIGDADPKTLYIGTNLNGVNVCGQDLRGMILTDFDLNKVVHDSSTLVDDENIYSASDIIIYAATRRLMFDGRIDKNIYANIHLETIDPFINNAAAFKGPAFIIFDERSYDEARVAAEKMGRIGRDFVGVLIESGRSSWTSESRLQASDHINPLVVIQRPGGFFPRSATIPSEAREAIRFISASWGRRDSIFLASVVFFMKAKGQGPRPMMDAAAQIFDRLSQLDLTPESSAITYQSPLAPDALAEERRSMERLLSPGWIELHKKDSGSAFYMSAFVTARRSSRSDYIDRLSQSIDSRAGSLRINVYRDTVVETRMRLGGREYYAPQRGRPAKSLLKYDDFPDSTEIFPDEIHSVGISAHSDLGSVAAVLLMKSELIVSARDLLGVEASIDGIWSLIASQTRRLVGPLEGSGRQLYLRILLTDALKRGTVHHDREKLITRICFERDFFSHYRVTVGRARFDGRRAVFRLRLQNAPFLSKMAETEVVDAAITVEANGVRVDEYDA